MSMESDLVALLKTLCATVAPDAAPQGTAPPWVTWQLIGGAPQRYTENTPMNRRMSYVQINAWCSTRQAAITLIRAIEDALCASLAFEARPNAEPLADHEPELELYGMSQDFSIFAPR